MIPITLESIYNVLLKYAKRDARAIIDCITDVTTIKPKSPEAQYIQTIGINYQGRVYASQEFWKTYLKEEKDLAVVLFHELYHQVTGDTRFILDFDKDDPEYQLKLLASNIAQDCRINCFLSKYSNITDASSFFIKFYNEDAIAANPLVALLRPGTSELVPTPELREAYDAYYSDEKGKTVKSFIKLYYLVLEYLRQRSDKNQTEGNIVFIGAHGEFTDSQGNPIEGEAAETLKKAIKQQILSQSKDKKAAQGIIVDGMTAGYSDTLEEQIVAEAFGIDQKLDFNMFKRMSFDSIMNNVRLSMLEKTNKRTKNIFIPSVMSRMDVFKLIYDFIPPFWDDKTEEYRPVARKVPIYLDVSGSMTSYLPILINMILNIRDDIDYVWGFSNKVVMHTMEDLRARKINSTGGTDFDCIIDHALENEFDSILVITDGYAYCKQPNGEKLEQIEDVVTVLCTDSRCRSNYFCDTYENVVDIEDIMV